MLERRILQTNICLRLHRRIPTCPYSAKHSTLTQPNLLLPRKLSRRSSTSKPIACRLQPQSRYFQTCTSYRADTAEGADSSDQNKLDSAHRSNAPAPISEEEYHEEADSYIETMLEKLEILQEDKGSMEVEYSAGVLTIELPETGTYVVNKQPPNKQIWLSSPVSGPKRYDRVAADAASQSRDWVYLRDGSTLSGLLKDEIGIDMNDDSS